MRKYQKNLMLATAAAIFIAAAPAMSWAQEAVRIGTSSVGSNFYRLGVGAGEIINKHGPINTTVEAVGGSAATVRSIGAGKVEFGIANAFASVTGYNGDFAFKKTGKVDIRLVVQGGQNFRAFMWRKRAKLKGPKDLEGRTIIGKRRPLPELELIMNALIKVYNLNPSKVKVVATTNTGQAMKALAVGSVDGALLPMGRRAGNIQKSLNDGHVEFSILPKAKRDEMLKHLPALLFGDSFKPADFDGLDVEAPVFAMNTLFITSPKVSENTVYKVVKAVFENQKEFISYHRDAAHWTLKNSLRKVQLPFHPGAIRYFKERGVWTAALEANQKKLMR